MPIRYRLAAICVVLALLPAIPLSILVKNLIDKSFDVGFSETMMESLDSGMAVSRIHLERIHRSFEEDAGSAISLFSRAAPDSSLVAALLSDLPAPHGIQGFILRTHPPAPDSTLSRAKPRDSLVAFWNEPSFMKLIGNSYVIERRSPSPARSGLSFYETENRAVQLALWTPPGGDYQLLLYGMTDPVFLAEARNLLAGRQLFAQLRLSREKLNRSFFYPFVTIYALILILSLISAFIMAERIARPIRRLVSATSAVAGGDWRIRLDERGGGEIGSLTSGFNRMVSRLDSQRRRLIDMEKMAAWREMARHLAHEIKNPILPIRLTVQEIRDRYRGEDGEYSALLSDSVRVVDEELSHLQSLVREFSSFARMPGLSPVRGSIEQAARDAALLYPAAKIGIESASAIPETSFDPDQMRRVLVNLFDNSISLTASGEAPAIDISIEHSGGETTITFSDRGPGIPADTVEKIFDPYYTTREDGTGLGLAIVKNIVLMHGGTIEAGNRGEGGAVFTIVLPDSPREGEPGDDPEGTDNR